MDGPSSGGRCVMPRGVYQRGPNRTVCSTCLTELPTETAANDHPKQAGHALIPLSMQQVEAWERGGCIVTVQLDEHAYRQKPCGLPVVDGRLCEGHAAQKARLA